MLALDKSVASREAVTELMRLKLSRDTKVSVVSVAQIPYIFIGDGYANSPVELTDEQIAPVREAAQRTASQIAEHFPDTDSLTTVADHVGDTIPESDAALFFSGGAGKKAQIKNGKVVRILVDASHIANFFNIRLSAFSIEKCC